MRKRHRMGMAGLVLLAACAIAASSPVAAALPFGWTGEITPPMPYALAWSADSSYVGAWPGAVAIAASAVKRSPARARRAEPSVEAQIVVRLPGMESIEIEPGEVVTARFVVSNATGRSRHLREAVSLPAGWSGVASAEPAFTLEPDEQSVRLITFRVPVDCPSQTYDLIYEAMDAADAAIRGRARFSVNVLPQVELGFQVIRAPRTAVAGTEFNLELSLANRGNTATLVHLQVSVRPDFEASLEPADILIPAGQARDVRVMIATGNDLVQRTHCLVVIEAMTSDEKGGLATVKEALTVDVIPRVTRITDPYYRLPSWVRLTLAADGDKAAGQVEVSGSGSIAGNTSRNLSYALRGSSEPMIGRYTSRDEAWVAYRGDLLQLDLGDRVYSLSPLVQRFRYGRGGGGRVSLWRATLGGYYARERSDEPMNRERGAFAALVLSRGVRLKANLLQREVMTPVYGMRPLYTIASLQGRYVPGPSHGFEIEYGMEDNSAGSNWGLRLEGAGVFRSRYYYTIEKVHAGPRFHGYYTDCDYTLATLQFPARPRLSLRFSYRAYANNLDLDAEKLAANSERNLVGGVTYLYNPRTRLTAELQDFRRRDRLETPRYDFGERTVKLSLGYTASLYSLYVSSEHGYFADGLEDRRTGLNRFSVSGSFRPRSSHSYNVYGRFGHGKYAEVPRRSDNLGLAGRWHLTGNLDMYLDYHVSGSPNLFTDTYSIMTHTLDYMLPNRHMLSLRASLWSTRQNGRGDYSVLLSYSIPAAIPMGRKETVGTIRGRVYEAEGPRRRPVVDAVITADGVAAVTDSRGQFEFPSLEPGTYSLQVDAKSIGIGRVTVQRSPFVVVVEGGKTSAVEIGVVRSSSISGAVLMFESGPEEIGVSPDSTGAAQAAPVLVGLGKGRDMPPGARGLPDVLVEISDGEDAFTQYTSSGGRFKFAGLRPGRWTVSIYPESLPHYYYVETRSIEVATEPGGSADVEFRILPRQRRIDILDEGEIKMKRR